MNFRALRIVLWAGVAIAAGIVLWQTQVSRPPSEPQMETQVAAVKNPYFTLTGSDGAPVDTSALGNTHQLVYFGFTYCPDVCPISARKMVTADVLYQLKRADVPLRTVFVSFDTERDTADVLAEYEKNLTLSVLEDFAGTDGAGVTLDLMALTGSAEDMDAAMAEFPTFVTQVNDPDMPDGYTFTHTDIIYWVRPDGSVELFSARHSADDIAATLAAWS
ncbi:MAG: SCO family protein [Sphingomonadales bacterium]